MLCFQEWAGILDKARQGGINVVQTYVFWNIHETEKGKVNEFGKQLKYLPHACMHVKFGIIPRLMNVLA